MKRSILNLTHKQSGRCARRFMVDRDRAGGVSISVGCSNDRHSHMVEWWQVAFTRCKGVPHDLKPQYTNTKREAQAFLRAIVQSVKIRTT